MKRMIFTFGLIVGLFGAGAAQAQQTWLPHYDKTSVLQVAPGMANKPGLEFTRDFADKVREKASVNGLEVHLIVTQQGNDLRSVDRLVWSGGILHTTLWDAWVREGMQQSRALVCLYIRGNDTVAGSIACRSGSYLHDLGLSIDQFKAENGPVRSVGDAGTFRTDAQTAFLTVLDNINNYVVPGPFIGSALFWFLVVFAIIFILAVTSKGGGSTRSSGSCSSCGSSGGGGCSSCSSCGGGA